MSERCGVLSIGAHAADQELSAGMVLAKYAKAGHQVTILSLTPGERGHPKLSSSEYAVQKKSEAKRCAEILGAESIVLDYRDAELPDTEEVRFEVCDIIRRLKPGIIITHWESSMHKDHMAAHRIAMDARFYAGLRRIERDQPAHWVGKIYFSENWEDMDGFEPALYVDTTDTFDQYCEALSSFELWHGGTGWPYSEYYKSLAKMRACIGFGMNGGYASTLARPKDAHIQRTRELP